MTIDVLTGVKEEYNKINTIKKGASEQGESRELSDDSTGRQRDSFCLRIAGCDYQHMAPKS